MFWVFFGGGILTIFISMYKIKKRKKRNCNCILIHSDFVTFLSKCLSHTFRQCRDKQFSQGEIQNATFKEEEIGALSNQVLILDKIIKKFLIKKINK